MKVNSRWPLAIRGPAYRLNGATQGNIEDIDGHVHGGNRVGKAQSQAIAWLVPALFRAIEATEDRLPVHGRNARSRIGKANAESGSFRETARSIHDRRAA